MSLSELIPPGGGAVGPRLREPPGQNILLSFRFLLSLRAGEPPLSGLRGSSSSSGSSGSDLEGESGDGGMPSSDMVGRDPSSVRRGSATCGTRRDSLATLASG